MSILNKKLAFVPSMVAFVMILFLFMPSSSASAESSAEFNESGITGEANLNPDSGKAEAMLLGARALNAIASSFAAQIKHDLPNASEFFIFPYTHQFDFKELRAFNTAYEILHYQAQSQTQRKAVPEGVMAATGVAADFTKKLLSYFKTDYTFSPVAITIPDEMLRNALAQKLRKQYNNSISILIPELFQPVNDTLPLELMKKLNNVSKWAKTSAEAKKLLNELIASDPKNPEPTLLFKIIEQYELYELIRNEQNEKRYIVYLGPNSLSGSMYTKKNLWSSLGANPFYVMSGAIASYAVVDSNTGNVVSSMLKPLHGGYYSISKIERLLRQPEK